MNVFTDEAVAEAVRFMAIPDNGKIRAGSASVHYMDVRGRLDDYLNVNMHIGGLRVPAYRLDGSGLWMSLTPMEVQSAWVPIRRANGLVVCGGLGLGYAPLRMAAKSNVEEVIVYETDGDCIGLFEQLHGMRKEAEKILIRHEDIREDADEITADFLWMDVYQTLLPDEVLTDAKLFTALPGIQEYRFWGQELCTFMIAHDEGEIPYWATSEERELFSMHFLSGLANLRPPFMYVDFANEVMEVMA